MIEARAVSKRYGEKLAVDELSFTVRPGVVTGFLGPNGAGKSTTMRLILGLDRPSSGTVTVEGRSYRDHPAPLAEVGALLEARAVHTSRSAYNHLRALAATHRIPRRRVDEVLEQVGLSEVARKRVGAFSLGMGQRLGIASALLGDPATVILDEPVNGLDPEGIRWVRDLLKGLAAEGRTVFLSSHLMAEMAQTADHVIVVGRGRLIADAPIAELTRSANQGAPVLARAADTDQAPRLADSLQRLGGTVTVVEDAALHVTGLDAGEIGRAALAAQIALAELTPQQASLEEAFMQMTRDAVEYRTERTSVGARSAA